MGARGDGGKGGRASVRIDGRTAGGAEGGTAGGTEGKAGRRRKRTFVLSDDASRLLDLHALDLEIDRSTAVERIIRAHCGRFVFYRSRPGDPGQWPEEHDAA